MELGNWDDDDFETPGAGPAANGHDDIFEFSTSLQLSDDENAPPEKELPPLEDGVEDLTNDRGVLLKRKPRTDATPPAAASASPDDKREEARAKAATNAGAATEGDATSDARSAEGTNGVLPPACPSKEEPFVELHYEGFLVVTGEKFDSSREQNYAMIVQLDIPPSGKSSVIRGLEVGLRELRAGDEATLTVSSRYAYGAEGAPDIPPHSDLRFELEVLDVRATHKRVVKVDSSRSDLTRLEDVRRERELAQQRREEESAMRDEEKAKKADRAAALREKLANKNKGGKKGGKKGKKNK